VAAVAAAAAIASSAGRRVVASLWSFMHGLLEEGT
jgi:hypothetical protein